MRWVKSRLLVFSFLSSSLSSFAGTEPKETKKGNTKTKWLDVGSGVCSFVHVKTPTLGPCSARLCLAPIQRLFYLRAYSPSEALTINKKSDSEDAALHCAALLWRRERNKHQTRSLLLITALTLPLFLVFPFPMWSCTRVLDPCLNLAQ